MTSSAVAVLERPEVQPDIDLYPSRTGDRPTLRKRVDPVVYGKSANGPLSKEQLLDYEKDGYLFFDALFTQDEIAELQTQVTLLKKQREEINADYIIEEPDNGEIRSFFHMHHYSPVFKALASNPKIARMAEQILGSKVYLHQSRINLKPGFRGKEFFWHSDFETWHVEDGMPRMRALSCTINLTDNTEYNGPLMVIPGSHKTFISCVGETPANHYKTSLRRQEYGVPDEMIITDMAEKNKILSLKGRPGSVVLFDCNLLHGSAGNITPQPRNNIFFVYNSILNILRDPYGGMPPRPEHIAASLNCETV